MSHPLRAAVGLTLVSASLSLAAVGGCSEDEPERDDPAAETRAAPSGRAAEAVPGEEVAIARAKRAAKQLGTTLKGRLTEAMEEGGPATAIEVCATEAQQLTQTVESDTGVSVGRSSLKLRNPDNAGPAWVREWLEEQGDRPAADVSPMAVVDSGEARFAAPIPLEGLCVTCHGPPEAIPEEVRTVLSERYPEDEAVGYAPGDLRGAIWATAPVDGS